MISLFARKRHLTPEMLTLPAYCVPADEALTLRSKREAQLEWMREKGVRYLLGNPSARVKGAHYSAATQDTRRVA
jgi:hypothetical protein